MPKIATISIIVKQNFFRLTAMITEGKFETKSTKRVCQRVTREGIEAIGFENFRVRVYVSRPT